MERIQLYPPDNLKEIMEKDAGMKQVSMSQLAVDILMKYYGLELPVSEKKPLSEIIQVVIKEVKEYIDSNSVGTTFDLLTASETFKNIHMVAEGKPSTNRATVGKVFASKLGKGSFSNIIVVRTDSGTVKKSSNRATLYRIL